MPNDLIKLTADIVHAHVFNNKVAVEDVPALIETVHATLVTLGQPVAEIAGPKPAVPVKTSVRASYIVCLEDGQRLQTLRRYLMARYGLTPDAYRAKWGLPADYPMIAENYRKRRSEIAKTMGLGRQGHGSKTVAEAVIEPVVEPVAPVVKAGRRKLGIVAAAAHLKS